MKLEQFYFDVEETDIALTDPERFKGNPIPGYKAIVTPVADGQDKTIAVVKNTYKLVRNRELIEPFLEQVDSLGVNWYIDESHTFAALNRMRLQVTFPDLYLQDSESDIPLSLYLHNSYDMSEGIRVFWGAIRAICTNGMVMGHTLGKFYARHTKGFDFEGINNQFSNATGKIEKLQRRIHFLESAALEEQFMDEVQKALGKRRLKEITGTDVAPDKSKWQLLNDITHHISHHEEKPKRADLQMKVSKVFDL